MKKLMSLGGGLLALVLLSGCASYPSLTEVAQRTNPDAARRPGVKPGPYAPFTITDFDVLLYSEQVKKKLATRFNAASGMRYGSSTTQATLAALAASAETFGWSAGTASGLALGSGYIFSLGNLIDTKGHAQAYEQAFTAIEAAEAKYLFHQLGGRFVVDESTGRVSVRSSNREGRAGIPSRTHLTLDGQSLYYRVTKTLKVLNDVLGNKIPDLQDLKAAKGESDAAADAPSGHPVADLGDGGRRSASSETVRHTKTPGPKRPPVVVNPQTPTGPGTAEPGLTERSLPEWKQELITKAHLASTEKLQRALELAPVDFDRQGDPATRVHVLIAKTTNREVLQKIEDTLK